ncbi:MAG TPA: alanine racemase [Pseudomonas sp.]|nr:alanine racemase [Pseudomonas sp.]
MKRRSLLGLGALAALGLWATRPDDRGRPHAAYFSRLNELLRREGAGLPLLVVDLDRLDANAGLLARRLKHAPRREAPLALRLVVKSLASQGLLDYLSRSLATQRFMLFHQTQLNQLARARPDADLLLGKPLSVAAALAFYQQLPTHARFDPTQQLTWLIDSPQRLNEYAELARALNQPLQIAFEIDIGLARGGFATPQALGEALAWLQAHSPPLRVRGLMGYDGHVAYAPPWASQAGAFAEATAHYRAFIASAQVSPLWPSKPLLNGAGSLTYTRHADGESPLNEVAVGSALLKPGAFDSELLAEHSPALWIASPVLKAQGGELPYLAAAQPLLQGWDRNRQRALYLQGGGWSADPVSPTGLDYDELYERSTNQERLIGSLGTALAVDDWVFLRPRQAEGLFEGFSELRLLRHGRLVGRWSPLSRA